MKKHMEESPDSSAESQAVTKTEFLTFTTYWGREWASIYDQMLRFFSDPIFYRSHFYAKERDEDVKDAFYLMTVDRFSVKQKELIEEYTKNINEILQKNENISHNHSRSIARLFYDAEEQNKDVRKIKRDSKEDAMQIENLTEQVSMLVRKVDNLEKKLSKREKRKLKKNSN